MNSQEIQDVIDALSEGTKKGNYTQSQLAISNWNYSAMQASNKTSKSYTEYSSGAYQILKQGVASFKQNGCTENNIQASHIVLKKLPESSTLKINVQNSATLKETDAAMMKKDMSHLRSSWKNRKRYKCKICGKVFALKINMHIHRINHSNTKHGTIVQSSKRHLLKKRMKDKSKNNNYKKQMTLLAEKRKKLLFTMSQNAELIAAHNYIMSQLAGSVTNIYQCKECGKSFSNINIFRQHQLMHNEIKNFTCTICGRGFSFAGNLRRHEKIHQNIRPYKCAECNLEFSQKSHLMSHLIIHNKGEVKQHICATCGASFSRQGNLRRHEKIHTQIKPHVCSVCGKCFLQPSHLKAHQVTHTNEKPYECELCGTTFGRKGNLMRHIKRIHEIHQELLKHEGGSIARERKLGLSL